MFEKLNDRKFSNEKEFKTKLTFLYVFSLYEFTGKLENLLSYISEAWDIMRNHRVWWKL